MTKSYISLIKINNIYLPNNLKIIKNKNIIKFSIVVLIIFAFYIDKSNKNIKILNKENKSIFRVNYIDGKLYWNNETFINLTKINYETDKIKELNISFENKSDFIKREHPKISLVITLYNQEKYLKLFYTAIQIQELKDIEIIFVDDASNDNTSSIINKLMEKDKRIIYLKNNINKRTFYSRNRGILEAKGEYILIIDPDDLLINNILIKAYETAKKYDLDIVQFYVIAGFFGSPKSKLDHYKYKSGILKNNTEIKNNFYNTISRNLWDKLVKREIYIKSIKFMREEFYNELYILNNDDTAFFGLLHSAETYGFLEQIGYFYVYKTSEIYVFKYDPKNSNLIIRTIFNSMRYFYIQSDNTILEKSNLAYKYFEKNIWILDKYFPYVTEGFNFILNVLDLYLNSFFSESDKNKLNAFRTKVIYKK